MEETIAKWVLLGLGFNGCEQLGPHSEPDNQDVCSLSVSTPLPLLTLSTRTPTRPELKISCTWDSLHITGESLKDDVVLTTGRWKTVLASSKLTKYNISEIKEVGCKMILNTDSKVLLATKDPQDKETMFVSEQELSMSGIPNFSTLEDGTLYALLKNKQFHSCTISPLTNDAAAKETISIGHQLLTSSIPIIKVSCGTDHVLLLSSIGSLFSMGLNSRGQLGQGDIETRTQPSLVAALDGLAIKDISCGHWHCLALSEIGDVYSWGWNQHKQLGHSESTVTVPMPTLVEFEKEDVNIVCISCGSKHSVALSDRGVVYGWGWNGYGQLGRRKEETITYPKCIELLETLTPVYVYCKYWNTLVLCENRIV